MEMMLINGLKRKKLNLIQKISMEIIEMMEKTMKTQWKLKRRKGKMNSIP